MLRLTLAARMTMIVVLSLLAVWIASIAAFYWSRTDEMESVRPPPARVAALTALIEAGDTAQRTLALEAVATDRFQPRLISSGTDAAAPNGLAVDEDIRRSYAEALGGRPLQLTSGPDSAFARWFARLAAARANALEFRITLHGGETLVIDTHEPLVINRIGLPVGFGAGLFGTLVAVIALLIMQRETKPLARLAAAVDRVDLSSDPVPLPQTRRSAPEIRALMAAFDRLQHRLGGMLRGRMGLIGGISHDVRTFATRLRLRIDRIPDDAERQRAVADIDDMIRLLDDALLSSRAGAGELSQEMVEFAALVRSEVEDRHAQGAAVDLRCDGAAENAVVLGDRLALRRIVANITENALKYGGAAHLDISVRGDLVVLIVDDEGPGIPIEKRELMLEPFSRIEESRSRGTGGAGLGLAIVRTLAEAHGGKVEIGETAKRGARITVTLPLFRCEMS
jgi:signal transduction histidine kinase